MALWLCLGCTTRYAVGLSRCPRCAGRDFIEEGAEVPKITVHGGTSDVNHPETMPTPKKAAPRKAAAKTEGGESPSPGSNTQPSLVKPPTPPAKSAPDPRSPAPTTASHSSGTPGDAGSSVPSTDGSRTNSAKKAAPKKAGGR